MLESQAAKLFPHTDDVAGSYPELIRYTPDNQEDLDWLCDERLIPVTQRNNCNVQLLVRDEVVKLKHEEQPDWNESNFMGFRVPEFMIRKMHKYFTELSIRNQRIRTNSGYFDTVHATVLPKEAAATATRPSSLSTSHATLSALLAGQEN